MLVIYHGNCADGFTSAWVARNYFERAHIAAEYVPAIYGQLPPDVTDRKVLMLDFSYKRPVLLQMAAVAKEIIIIDHHKTAAEDLIDLPSNVTTIFNMDHSGAMLTWLYFHAAHSPEDAPELIKRVEDRDLWRFKFHDSRPISAWMFAHEYTFENWDKLASESMKSLAVVGEAIEKKHFKDIKELMPLTQVHVLIDGEEVVCYNLPYTLSSDVGHAAAKLPNALYGACFWLGNDRVTFSLRSEGDFDVSAIAKKYGGGGHKNAAGFSVSLRRFITNMLYFME